MTQQRVLLVTNMRWVHDRIEPQYESRASGATVSNERCCPDISVAASASSVLSRAALPASGEGAHSFSFIVSFESSASPCIWVMSQLVIATTR